MLKYRDPIGRDVCVTTYYDEGVGIHVYDWELVNDGEVVDHGRTYGLFGWKMLCRKRRWVEV